jgi:hypothetical protein
VSALQPHLKRYWLTPPPDDPAELAAQICTVCEVYEATPALAAAGTHVASTDEMTGIQALERLHPSLPMQPGHVEREEFEYQRHGTLSLIANLDVATGQIMAPSIGPTRTVSDFAAHITQTIQTDPDAAWIFVTDQLNTHQSETLVRLVAAQCDIQQDLGENSQKRPSRFHEHTRRLSLRPRSSHPFRLYSQTQLLAQPD